MIANHVNSITGINLFLSNGRTDVFPDICCVRLDYYKSPSEKNILNSLITLKYFVDIHIPLFYKNERDRHIT